MQNTSKPVCQCIRDRFRLKYILLLLIPPLIALTIFYDQQHDLVYLPISISISAFLIFMVFPGIILGLHAKPIYYDDLIIKDYNDSDYKELYDDKFRRKYQTIFQRIITLTSSLVLFIIIEVWYIKSDLVTFKGPNISYIPVDWTFAIALIGGIINVYYKVISMVGKILLVILKLLKKRTINKSRQHMSDIARAELGNAGVTISRTGALQTPFNQIQRRSHSHNDLTIIGIAPDAMDMNDILSHLDN